MGKEKTHSSFSLFAATVGNVNTCYLVLGHHVAPDSGGCPKLPSHRPTGGERGTDLETLLMSTKNYPHNLKVELFYLVKMFRVPSLGDSMSVALRKLLQGRRRGSQATNKFVTKGAANLNIEDQILS